MDTQIQLFGVSFARAELTHVGESLTPKLRFAAAVNRKPVYGETPDERGRVTDWYNVEYWGNPAAALYEQIKADKVKFLHINGSLTLRKWAKDGKSGTSADIRAHQIGIAQWKQEQEQETAAHEEVF